MSPSEPEAPGVAPRERRGRGYRVFMRWTRRIHMYAGLFMLPWVLVYGTSALFFNHVDLLPTHQVRPLPLARVDGLALSSLPEPTYYAQRVVAGLRARGLEVTAPARSRYVGYVHLSVFGDRDRHELFFDPARRDGFVRTRVFDGDAAPALRQVGSLGIDDPLRPFLEADAMRLLEAQGDWPERVVHRSGPVVEFETATDGEAWRITYDVGNQSLRADPLQRRLGSISARDFLTRLHLTHTYPLEGRWQTLWAVAVDLLAGGLIVWALSGILMWWQMPKVRLWGGVTLAASVLVAGGLGWAMYAVFTN